MVVSGDTWVVGGGTCWSVMVGGGGSRAGLGLKAAAARALSGGGGPPSSSSSGAAGPVRLSKAAMAALETTRRAWMAAPASKPAAHIQQHSALVSDIVRAPEMRAKLFHQGWQVVGSSPEGLANRIASDTAALGHIIRSQKIEQP